MTNLQTLDYSKESHQQMVTLLGLPDIEKGEEIEIDPRFKNTLFPMHLTILDKIINKKKKEQQYADSFVVDQRGYLLILQRTKNDDFENEKWGLPGGKVEDGESIKDACLRELAEETNILEDDIVSVSELDSFKNDNGGESHYFYIIVDSTNIVLDIEEHQDYLWIKPDLDLLQDIDFMFKEELLNRIEQFLKTIVLPVKKIENPLPNTVENNPFITGISKGEIKGAVFDAFENGRLSIKEFISFLKVNP